MYKELTWLLLLFLPVCACVYSFRILSFLHRVLKVFIGSYTSEVYRLYVCVSLSAISCVCGSLHHLSLLLFHFFSFSTAGLYLDFLVIFHPQLEQVSFMYQRVDVVTVPPAGARSTLQREDVTERLNNCCQINYQQAIPNIFNIYYLYIKTGT